MPKINRVFTAESDVSNWIDTKKRTSEGFVLSHLINRLLRALMEREKQDKKQQEIKAAELIKPVVPSGDANDKVSS